MGRPLNHGSHDPHPKANIDETRGSAPAAGPSAVEDAPSFENASPQQGDDGVKLADAVHSV